MLLLLWDSVLVICCFFFALLDVNSSFAIILIRKKELLAFVFPVSRDCCMPLPCDAMGSSAVCDFGIA